MGRFLLHLFPSPCSNVLFVQCLFIELLKGPVLRAAELHSQVTRFTSFEAEGLIHVTTWRQRMFGSTIVFVMPTEDMFCVSPKTAVLLSWCPDALTPARRFDPQQTGFKGNLRLLIKPFEQPHLPFKILSAALRCSCRRCLLSVGTPGSSSCRLQSKGLTDPLHDYPKE